MSIGTGRTKEVLNVRQKVRGESLSQARLKRRRMLANAVLVGTSDARAYPAFG